MPALAFMMLQMLVVWGQGIILPKTPSVFMGRKRSHCTRQKSYEPTSPPPKMNECNLKRTISKGKHFFQPEFFGRYSLVFGRNKSLFKCNYEWRSLRKGDANCYQQGEHSHTNDGMSQSATFLYPYHRLIQGVVDVGYVNPDKPIQTAADRSVLLARGLKLLWYVITKMYRTDDFLFIPIQLYNTVLYHVP